MADEGRHGDGRVDLGKAALRVRGCVSTPAGGSVLQDHGQYLRPQTGCSCIHINRMTDLDPYCNSFATASSDHENDITSLSCKALRKCFTLRYDQNTGRDAYRNPALRP